MEQNELIVPRFRTRNHTTC